MTKKMLSNEQTQLSGQDFRPMFVINKFASYKYDNENYDYYGAIYNYDHDPLAVEKCLDDGWEVCLDTGNKWQDTRGFSPDNSDVAQQNTVPSPVQKTTKDGYKMVLLRMPKEKRKELEARRNKEYQEQYAKAVGGTTTRTKGHIHVRGDDINV